MFRIARAPMKLKSQPLRVYLAAKKGTNVEYPAPIRRRVHDHFRTIVKKSGKFAGVEVSWATKAPKLGKYDLVVYFVDSPSDTVVRGLYSGAQLGDTGTTVVGSKGDVASEVYLEGNQDDPYGLGNLAFHELMHNVTKMRQELHTQPLISLAKHSIDADTPLSSGDVNLMVKHLKGSRQQYMGGF